VNLHPQTAEKLFWRLGWVYDFSKLATVILVLGLLTHYFFYSALVVRGTSMDPNYFDGEVLLIDKISYRLKPPERFDVIAMYFPGETEKRFIKRIIALPGEKVEIRSGRVAIDGWTLDENYLDQSITTGPDLKRRLTSNEYFVLGDNRFVSSDSRAWGAVPRSYIIGKVGNNPLFRLPAR